MCVCVQKWDCACACAGVGVQMCVCVKKFDCVCASVGVQMCVCVEKCGHMFACEENDGLYNGQNIPELAIHFTICFTAS